MKYRKIPIIVEATQWFKNGDHPLDYANDFHTGVQNGRLTTIPAEHRRANNWEGDVVRYFRHPHIHGGEKCVQCDIEMHKHGWIDTLEGGHIVCVGDWIITGIAGEHYPCKPDIFAKTYEEYEPSSITTQTCPKCGADERICKSKLDEDGRYVRSPDCYERQIEDLTSDIKKLRRENIDLSDALDDYCCPPDNIF